MNQNIYYSNLNSNNFYHNALSHRVAYDTMQANQRQMNLMNQQYQNMLQRNRQACHHEMALKNNSSHGIKKTKQEEEDENNEMRQKLCEHYKKMREKEEQDKIDREKLKKESEERLLRYEREKRSKKRREKKQATGHKSVFTQRDTQGLTWSQRKEIRSNAWISAQNQKIDKKPRKPRESRESRESRDSNQLNVTNTEIEISRDSESGQMTHGSTHESNICSCQIL